MERCSHKWKFLIDNISKSVLEAWLRGDFFAGFCGGLAYSIEKKNRSPKAAVRVTAPTSATSCEEDL
jgi:hypothetical protein